MAQLLSQVAVGSIVKLNESGSPVEFYVAKHDYESGLNGAGRTLLVRKDCYNRIAWSSTGYNAWASSTMLSWLNSTYKTLLDANIQSLIGTTTYYYTPGNGNWSVTTRSDAIFVLSLTELGLSYSGANTEGSALSIASTLQIAYLGGTPAYQWARSPYTQNTNMVWSSSVSGSPVRMIHTNSDGGSRPIFTLPGSALYVLDDGTVTTNQLPTAPGSITVPTVAAGQPCAITWTAATDPDGTIASYTLERSVNGSGWTQVFSGNALTYTDTIGSDWGTVAYRVCAVDNYGASGPYATSETQTVQDGILYISGPAADMGSKTAPFVFAISTGVSGSEAVVTDIAVKISLDGNQIYSGTVDTGEEISATIDTRTIGGGSHTIEATASKTDYVAVNESYTFSTPSIALPSGGLGVQLQDDQGRAVFPQSIASLIGGLYGQSVAGNLQQLAKSVLFNRIATPKYQEVTVDLSTAQEGDIVQLPEGGTMVDFYVAKLDYESGLNGAGRTLLVRKGIYGHQAWNSSGTSAYANGTMDTWLNGTYKALLDTKVQSSMGTTQFYYTIGNNNDTLSTLSRSVFLLSLVELGKSETYAGAEGSALPIANTLQIAYDSLGRASSQWTRSPVLSNPAYAWELNHLGATEFIRCNSTGGACPAFTLPSNFTATYYIGPDGIHDAQEYTEGGTYTDLFGNDIPVPRVETGSYAGTGTYGVGSPNTLMFDFVPKLIIISIDNNTYGGYIAWGSMIWVYNSKMASSWVDAGNNSNNITCSLSGTTFSWYTTGTTDSSQLNQWNASYNYIAIG